MNIPGLNRPNSAYDLGLYFELGTTARAVLVVTVIGHLRYLDGSGPNLAWTATTRADFTSRLQAALTQAWAEKHVLRTVTPTALTCDTIGVAFDIQLSEALGATDHSHWTIEVTKVVPGWVQSSTRDPVLGGLLNGALVLDSEDLTPENKGGPVPQRAAVHEFGHMMGYLDEYLNAKGEPEGVPGWTTDQVSVMTLGETVQPRHYVWFAEWCNGKYAATGQLTRKPINWLVNGVVDKTAARI